METNLHEIADGIYRISTLVPEVAHRKVGAVRKCGFAFKLMGACKHSFGNKRVSLPVHQCESLNRKERNARRSNS